MNRPWLTFGAFAASVAVGVVVLAGLTAAILQMEQSQRAANARAAFEENVRLAMWRMEAMVSPMVARESARRPGSWRPFEAAPNAITDSYVAAPQNTIRLPSPLLGEPPARVRIHFQIEPDGQLTSPQAPTSNDRDLAEIGFIQPAAVDRATSRLAALGELLRGVDLAALLPAPDASGDMDGSAGDGINDDPRRDTPAAGEAPATIISGGHDVTGDVATTDQPTATGEPGVNAGLSRQAGDATSPNASPNALDRARGKTSQQQGKPSASDDVVSNAISKSRNEYEPRAQAYRFTNEAVAAQRDRVAGDLVLEQQRTAPMQQAEDSAPSEYAGAMPNTQGQQQMLGQRDDTGHGMDQVQQDAQAQSVMRPRQAATLSMQRRGFSVRDTDTERVGPIAAVWVKDDQLLLARRVERGGQAFVQGAWIDWPAVSAMLLAEVDDLLPAATLTPARASVGPDDPMQHSAPPKLRMIAGSLSGERDAYAIESAYDPARLLASLPVQLNPGPMPAIPAAGWNAIRQALVAAWVAAAVATIAIALLLVGAMGLAQRRGAFVSAVTHELRTPLTTFRLYAEMLRDDVVREPVKRRQYLDTLTREADRLSHLVENVLAYARLERGRRMKSSRTANAHMNAGATANRASAGAPVATTMDQLLSPMIDRLQQRAQQAEVSFVMDIDAAAARATVLADAAGVEQVLFNLVDNACKYAGERPDAEVRLTSTLERGRGVIRVCDNGPGIDAATRRRLFQPFSKSARAAANSAPGVGLGLALSKRYAKQMGAQLVYETRSSGACFALRLRSV